MSEDSLNTEKTHVVFVQKEERSDDSENKLRKVMSISAVLRELELRIPNYQRPYRWTYRNVIDLLSDIEDAIRTGKDAYRVGTLILYRTQITGNPIYEIVDGQQRILTFILLYMVLDTNFTCSVIEDRNYVKMLLHDDVSKKNLYDNFQTIRGYINNDNRARIEKAMNSILQIIVISVDQMSEAFQLFDSQNTRGKSLDPHDLLKAYHLREINNKYIMRHKTEQWENVNTLELRELFNHYLNPITNWIYGKKVGSFREKDIDIFKGIRSSSNYSFGKRIVKSMPFFQLGEQFEAGEHFFEMVHYYLQMLKDIKMEIVENHSLEKVRDVLENGKDGSIGFDHAKRLFYSAMLAYYDHFGFFNIRAVNKICLWAFMIRLDVNHLGFDTINKYAIGEKAENYSNSIPMFSKIKNSRSDQDIANVDIKFNKNEGHDVLRQRLKKIFMGDAQ